jgi:hypothetical protein
VPGPQQIRALDELSTTGAKCIVLPEQKYQVMLAKKAAELSLLFLRENRAPVIPISFRNRLLALAPAIAGG